MKCRNLFLHDTEPVKKLIWRIDSGWSADHRVYTPYNSGWEFLSSKTTYVEAEERIAEKWQSFGSRTGNISVVFNASIVIVAMRHNQSKNNSSVFMEEIWNLRIVGEIDQRSRDTPILCDNPIHRMSGFAYSQLDTDVKEYWAIDDLLTAPPTPNDVQEILLTKTMAKPEKVGEYISMATAIGLPEEFVQNLKTAAALSEA